VGLADWDPGSEPLPDRVEIAAVRFLQKQPACSLRELETVLNAELPGLLTPSLGQLRAVLASYAIETDGHWSLRPEDAPSARRLDLESAAQSLVTLAARLGYRLERDEKNARLIRWMENDQTIYRFHLLASAVTGRILRQAPDRPSKVF